MNLLGLPVGANPDRDIPWGTDELGNPQFRASNGTIYSIRQNAIPQRQTEPGTLARAGEVGKEYIGGAIQSLFDAVTAPRRALSGEGVTYGDALNTAGMLQLGGASVARPAGSVGMGGRIVDFNAARSNRARNELINKIEGAVNDVQSGAYQQRIDAAGFDLHRQGSLPLQVGSRVRPPKGWDMDGDWRVDGYWIDQQNPQRYGYKLINEDGAVYDAAVSDPKLGLRMDDPSKFGGGFTAYSGPRGEALSYRDRPPMERQQVEPVSPEVQAELDAFWNEINSNRDATTGAIALAAPRNPAEAMAHEILTMRAQGRAKDVTDAMMAQADPQYMYANTPLAMDAESRMARAQEMGFDTGVPLYHGSDAWKIEAFDPSKGMERLPATFFSESRDVAKTYGDVGEFFTRTDYPAEFDFYGGSRIDFNNENLTPGGLVRQVKQAINDAERYGADTESDLAFDLQSAGVDPWYADEIDAVKMRNVVDSFGWDGEPANNLAVFDPTKIRRTTARFDPEFSHLANLSAANVSPEVGLLGMNTDDEQRKMTQLLNLLGL